MSRWLHGLWIVIAMRLAKSTQFLFAALAQRTWSLIWWSVCCSLFIAGCGTPVHEIAVLTDCALKPDKYGQFCLGKPPPGSGSVPFGGELEKVGSITTDYFFPAGQLLLASATVHDAGTMQKRAWLVVNLAAASSSGDRSFSALTVFNCSQGSLAVERTEWSPSINGGLPSRNAQNHVPPLTIESPAAALRSAMTLLCGS